MKYDFETLYNRHGMDALAVDLHENGSPRPPKEGFDQIPMWIADMNFATVPTIPQAIAKRLEHPLFGYFEPREEYYNSIISWQKNRNGVTGLEREDIDYVNGVLGGVVAVANVLCSKGDKILVHSPTYVGFTHALVNNGYELVHSPLVKDGQGVWRMDYADMERRLKQEHIHCAILCSPHNPCGRVWERWELEKAMELFQKYDVYVISDEIWSDLILEGYKHIPTQSISQDARMRTAAMYAPSKTFNLAGLVGSYTVIYNSWLRDRFRKEQSLSHFNEMNVLSMHALIGAYQAEGCQWLEELRQVLTKNVDFACTFIEKELPGVTVQKPQGTYMLFVDCTGWCNEHGVSLDTLLQRCWDVGVAVQDGRPFHGENCIRMNLALPLARVQEAFARMKKYAFAD